MQSFSKSFCSLDSLTYDDINVFIVESKELHQLINPQCEIFELMEENSK